MRLVDIEMAFVVGLSCISGALILVNQLQIMQTKDVVEQTIES